MHNRYEQLHPKQQLIPCYCGCGGFPRKGNVFIFHHGGVNNKGKKHRGFSSQARKNISLGKMGDKNPMRINRHLDEIIDANTLKNRIRGALEFKEWTKKVRELDGYICVDCERSNVRTEVHHIIPLLTIIKKGNLKTLQDALNCPLIWDINNGKVLCRKCHMKGDGRLGKLVTGNQLRSISGNRNPNWNWQSSKRTKRRYSDRHILGVKR
jgi:hypothetical protein